MSEIIGRALICHAAWMSVHGLLLCLGVSDYPALIGGIVAELVIASKLLIPALNRWIDEGDTPSDGSGRG